MIYKNEFNKKYIVARNMLAKLIRIFNYELYRIINYI